MMQRLTFPFSFRTPSISWASLILCGINFVSCNRIILHGNGLFFLLVALLGIGNQRILMRFPRIDSVQSVHELLLGLKVYPSRCRRKWSKPGDSPGTLSIQCGTGGNRQDQLMLHACRFHSTRWEFQPFYRVHAIFVVDQATDSRFPDVRLLTVWAYSLRALLILMRHRA
jgi:hypothetical protein